MSKRGWLMAGFWVGAALVAAGVTPGSARAQGQTPGERDLQHIIGQAGRGNGIITLYSGRDNSVPLTPGRQTLNEALGEVYLTSPDLQAEQAKLRATDEQVPTALSGWRPQISYQMQPGWGYGDLTSSQQISGNPLLNIPTSVKAVTQSTERWTFSQQLTVTQPVWRGGRTTAATAQAEGNVRAERANLIAQQEQSLANGMSAYVNAVQDQQLYEINSDNVSLAQKTLDATRLRFKLGEVTRTDVAQAEAGLAQAQNQLATAYSQLQTALATYRSEIGPVPQQLVAPQPLAMPARTEQQAEAVALANNAAILNAAYADGAAKDAVNVAFANLMPEFSLQGTAEYNNQPYNVGLIQRGGILGGMLQVPIYQGGSEYAAIRQAKQQEQEARKQLDAARDNALQLVAQYWQGTVQAREAAQAASAAVRADEIALDGVEREALAGTETTYDVLLAEQALLNARVTQVQNVDTLVTDSYQLAGAVGRLTVSDLGLKVPHYNPNAYYKAVRMLPFGTGDYATHQPGR